MTTLRHLDQALADLLRAKESAEFFHYPVEMVERIDLLKRATAKVKRQVEEKQESEL
jgi:hypothetical protein